MEKVVIDPGCTTCGLCEFIVPDVFQVTDKAHVRPDADLIKNKTEIEIAVRSCPVNVIRYEK